VEVVDDIFVELLEEYMLACELLFVYEGWDCDEVVDNVDCPSRLFPSKSPLSEVAVVRLPPDPLRIRTVPL
jgi:hypothetical protein